MYLAAVLTVSDLSYKSVPRKSQPFWPYLICLTRVYLAAVLSVSDLPNGRVELDVQSLTERDRDAAVPIPHR